MWELQRYEDGAWRDTGETFEGDEEALAAYLDERRKEDGWDYRGEPV